MRIVLVGGKGLIGSEITKKLTMYSDIELIQLSREDIQKQELIECDIFVNANGSGNKTECNKNSIASFENNCMSIIKYYKKIRTKRVILISSVDATLDNHKNETDNVPDSSSNYSMHKNFAERLCKELYPKLTILRVGGLVGEA